MRNAKDTLEATYLEMRWRALSLAADLDRIEAAPGSESVMNDVRIKRLKEIFKILADSTGVDRAERVQNLLNVLASP